MTLGVKPLLIADRRITGEASVGHRGAAALSYALQVGWRVGVLAISARALGLASPGQPLLL
ncbi:MAG TPA: hypothetical protein VHS28_00930 [Chloroflexota bacterium]|nr:hypothetical protein [Chloroflexota bacterium]